MSFEFLSELYGYRSSEEVAKFKSILQHSSDAHEQRDNLEQFLYYLEEKGFEVLGSGVFGAVFKHPKLNYCIKMFKNDASYIKFVKICLANTDNPHLPKFRGKIMKIDREHFAVRIERLDYVLSGNLMQNVVTTLSSLAYFNKKGNIDLDEVYYRVSRNEVAVYLDAHFDIIETLNLLIAKKGSSEMDLHTGNFMMRGNTLVFTDPYAYGNT